MRAVRQREPDVDVERVEERAAPVRIADERSGAERDAESKATQALSAQRDWQPDLRGVTVHDDETAQRSADSIGAAAYTKGSDIYLGSEYEAGTPHGDHVLAHELAHVGQQHGPDEVHRYPATALTQPPVDWAGQTGSVFRPAAGVSGGVYILTTSDTEGEIKKVVVKPIFGASGLGAKESGESLAFGDKALGSLLGINTPTSRPVKAGTAEFSQLVQICAPHQPAKPAPGTDNEDMWQPLSAAQSFVVMGEVPGKSVSSLAEKAATDPDAMNALYRSVLDETFVEEMGRVSVGDILIGNNDRMVSGAMNLGNIMVELNDGRAKMWAIDTNAVLGKKFNPKDVVQKGTTSSTMAGGFENAKNDLKSGGAKARIEGFFEILINRMKGSAPKAPESTGPSPVEVFEDYYRASAGRLVSAFERGWDTALIDVFALVNTKEGRAKMKSLTDEAKGTDAEEDLDYTALKLNAAVLANQASGDDDQASFEELGAVAAAKQLAMTDTTRMQLPVDQFAPDAAQVPGGSALSTELTHPSSLPAPNRITHVVDKKWFSHRPAKLAEIGTAAANAKAEVAQLGTKSKGVFKKKDVPRNRAVVGDFVANTYLVGAGAIRAVTSAAEVAATVEQLTMAVGGSLKPSTAASTLGTARFVKAHAPTVDAHLAAYASALRADARGVSKIKKYDKASDLASTLEGVAQYMDDMSGRFDKSVTMKNPSMLVEILASKARG